MGVLTHIFRDRFRVCLVVVLVLLCSGGTSAYAADDEADARRQVLRAGIMEARKDFEGAAKAYEAVVEGLSADHELSLQARQSLVELYFAHPDLLEDQAILLGHIDALDDVGKVETSDRVNWRLVLAVDQVAKSQAIDAWDAAVAKVVADVDDTSLSEGLLGRLDHWMEQAKGNAVEATLETVLTDLVLLSPGPESLRRIQWRRIAWYESQEQWSQAIEAAELDVLLGALSEDGPETAIDRCVGLMRSAGQSDEQVAAWTSNLYSGQTQASLIEERLQTRAKQRLGQWKNATPYQAAVLQALAGQSQDALVSLGKTLTQTTTSDDMIRRDLSRSAWVLSLVDGHWSETYRLGTWLASPGNTRRSVSQGWAKDSTALFLVEQLQDQAKGLAQDGVTDRLIVLPPQSQAALVRPIIQQRKGRVTDRITRAEQNNFLEAELAWRLILLDLDPRLSIQQEQLRAWAADKQASLGGENAAIWMQALSERLEHPALKQEMAYAAAMLHYSQGALEQAIAGFDELIKLGVKDSRDRQDWRLARVVAMAGLQRWDDAAEAIETMKLDRAERLFVAGWLSAKASEADEALTLLRRLRDEFPDSPEAGLAVGLLSALEAAQ